MSRTMSLVLGGVLILLGIFWTLQGLNVIGGSGMSGHAIWAVIGVIVGVALVVRAPRRTSGLD